MLFCTIYPVLEGGVRSEELGVRSEELGVQEFRSSGVQECRRMLDTQTLIFNPITEFVSCRGGSAYPPEKNVNSTGRYADLPLLPLIAHRSTLILQRSTLIVNRSTFIINHSHRYQEVYHLLLHFYTILTIRSFYKLSIHANQCVFCLFYKNLACTIRAHILMIQETSCDKQP